MSVQESGHYHSQELRITRDTAEFVALDASLNTDHVAGAVWPSINRDPRFINLIHSVLEHGSKKYSGHDELAIARYEGLIEGMSFTLEAVSRAMSEQSVDNELLKLLNAPDERE